MKKISILILGLVLVAGACNRPAADVENTLNPIPEPTAQTETNTSVDTNTEVKVTPPVVAKTYEIKIMSSSFEPSSLTIKKGDTVKFINTDSVAHWPASAPHPTHTAYPEFDPKKGIAAGESWSFTFDKVGEWKFHDHLKPSFFGSITVQ